MTPERKLYHDLKKKTHGIIWNRIENLSVLGMPDVLGYNANRKFFTVELKVTQGNKVKFSPHQIAFHKSHPDNTFILLKTHGQCVLKLVPGSEIHDLRTKGHDTIFTVAEDWKGVQITFENIF
jgi:Holliday junction resolvase